MKITHNKVGQNLNIKDSGKADQTDKAKAGGAESKMALLAETDLGATKVDVSERAQQMKKAKEIARATPDIDEEKVARLQKLIDSGKYHVPASEIASKMVDEEAAWS